MIASVIRLRASLRSRLWPLPAIIVVLAVATGLGLPRVDAHLDAALPTQLSDLLFGGDPDAARTLLDTVASSLITVTALTFSLTVVTLQLASSQFSPRLLRTFTRDLFVQITLALFLGTFAYSLSVLRSVRSGTTDSTAAGPATGDRAGSVPAFVPQISVTLAFVLALASVVALGAVPGTPHSADPRGIHARHRARGCQCNRSGDAAQSSKRQPGTVDDDGGTGAGCASEPPRGDGVGRFTPADARFDRVAATLIAAPSSGFLTHLDEQALLGAAVAHDLVIALDVYPGCFLVEKTPLGRYWSA